MKRWFILVLLIAITLILTACGGDTDDEQNNQDNMGEADNNTQKENQDEDK